MTQPVYLPLLDATQATLHSILMAAVSVIGGLIIGGILTVGLFFGLLILGKTRGAVRSPCGAGSPCSFS